MTIKEQLIKEIEQAPENLVIQLLSFLHLLQSQPQDTSPVANTLEKQLKSIDGFMIIQENNLPSNIDWVSLIREERINDLM
ncbi:MAG: hypothetical protein HC916_14725 [Coleofasciculaceae cyanobacterium SM2_1_6]|nr:hypothetical protein [Coleofasciculaceae cyanobacterium SM2_1_6]